MTQVRSSNGRPEPEVIVNVRLISYCDICIFLKSAQFSDGYAYSKGKMEEAFRNGGLFDKPVAPTKAPKESHIAKKEDVDLIVCPALVCCPGAHDCYSQVRELEIPRAHAERALSEANGNLTEALLSLITPKPVHKE